MSSHIDPERDQFEAFKALPRDQPVMMLNLVRFRDRAAYCRLIRTGDVGAGEGFAG